MLEERVVQAILLRLVAHDDRTQLLVVSNEDNLLGIASHYGNQGFCLRAHATFIHNQLWIEKPNIDINEFIIPLSGQTFFILRFTDIFGVYSMSGLGIKTRIWIASKTKRTLGCVWNSIK